MSISASENTGTIKFGYGDVLVNWLKDEGYENNTHLMDVFKSDIDDRTKFLVAMAFYDSPSGKSGGHSKDVAGEMVHLEPYEKEDGSFCYVNRMTGKIDAMVERQPNGLFSLYMLSPYLEKLGGRGSLSGIIDRMADGKYFDKN